VVAPDEAPVTGAHDLVEALAVEWIEEGLYRANFVQVEEYSLFGGQVAAQALAAAGATVPPGRVPHSLHGYFLRPGASERPTLLQVERDRDGRSFSARRVVAIQQGKVIFNLSVSFHETTGEDVQQFVPAPEFAAPEDLPEVSISRYPAIELRADPPTSGRPLPDRFWARVRHALPADEHLHACALTYISDMSTGLVQLVPDLIPVASIDHALWIHRIPRADDWLLVDLVGQALAGRRGHYSGSVFSRDGRLVASLAQEMVVRHGAPS